MTPREAFHVYDSIVANVNLKRVEHNAVMQAQQVIAKLVEAADPQQAGPVAPPALPTGKTSKG